MSQYTASVQSSEDNDIDMIAIWLRKDPTRWIAGVITGIFAGVVGLIVSGIFAAAGGVREFMFPFKVAALPFVGPTATAFDAGAGVILAGLLFTSLLCGFWGFVFSHFVWSKRAGTLLVMGLVWGSFSWIFWGNLYLQSIPSFHQAHISSAMMLPMCFGYGLALSALAVIDPMIRGK